MQLTRRPSFSKHQSRILIFMCFLGLILQAGCTVKLENETPGAKQTCNQGDTALLNFCTVYNDVIVGEGCTGCHQSGSAGGNAMAFVLPPGGCNLDTSESRNAVQANFCTSLLKGDKLVDYPRSDAHTGANLAQLYTTAEIQNLIDWVNDQKN